MKDLYFKVVAILIAIFMGVSRANAQAKISYIGNNEVYVGDTFTLNVKLNDIEDLPIIGIGGEIVFDSEYLELVKMKGMDEPFPMRYNEKYYIFSGFSMEAKGISEEAEILTLTFKALKEGITNLSFKETELSDYNAKIVDVLEIPYELNINNKIEIKENIINDNKEEIVNNQKVDNKIVNKEKNIINSSKIKETNKVVTLEDNKSTEVLDNINKLFNHFKSLSLNNRKNINKENKKSIYITIKNVIKNILKKEQ